MVDAGISYPFKIKNVKALQEDPNFLSACMISSSKIKNYADFNWSGDEIAERTSGGWFFFNFLKRAGWKVLLQSNLGNVCENDFDEICSIVLEKVADAVGEFTPVSSRNDSKTWGFEAYLQNYALKKAIRPCFGILGSPVGNRKNRASFVSLNGDDLGWDKGNLNALENSHPDLFSNSDYKNKGIYSFDEKKCKNLIFCSVRDALIDHPGAEAYVLHVINGQTIRETCKTLDLSKSQCHRLVQGASEKVWANLNDAVNTPPRVH